MFILGIETSCDDTSVCILESKENESAPRLISTLTSNQDDVLEYWGGVVPEISARNHHEKLPGLLRKIFKEVGIDPVNPKELKLIGVTNRPGLIGPLLTGVNASKALSLIHHIPIFPVNHLLAHLQAIHLTDNIPYPYIGVLVTGGNALICLVNSANNYEIIGRGIDDAPGEAFDKGGRMLGLGYPAGSKIDELSKNGDPFKYSFPIGLKNLKGPSCDMSFSGVKTSLRYFLEKNPISNEQMLHDLCASFQCAIVAAIMQSMKRIKTISHKIDLSKLPIVLGGGVACNSYLREQVAKTFTNSLVVDKKYCADNAAMIAHMAYLNKDQALAFPDCLSFEVFSTI